MIQLFHVCKRYPTGQVALDDVSFEIAKGEFCFLTGASGAGKTTLLRLIFREETPSEGQILVNGRNVAAIPRSKIPYLRRSIGVVFQDFRLIDRKTIFENVDFLPRVLGLDAARRKKMAFEALRRVGLAHRMAAFPRQLSGGEQQRVAIARAMVTHPALILADEPTGNLDSRSSLEIMRLFQELNRVEQMTIILVTHEPDIARCCQRIISFRDGLIESDEVVSEPIDAALQLGQMAGRV